MEYPAHKIEPALPPSPQTIIGRPTLTPAPWPPLELGRIASALERLVELSEAYLEERHCCGSEKGAIPTALHGHETHPVAPLTNEE
jgi:hypothetical protein